MPRGLRVRSTADADAGTVPQQSDLLRTPGDRETCPLLLSFPGSEISLAATGPRSRGKAPMRPDPSEGALKAPAPDRPEIPPASGTCFAGKAPWPDISVSFHLLRLFVKPCLGSKG